jgi:3-polyprenyl-4-hydroxybenzoate decarboxylase
MTGCYFHDPDQLSKLFSDRDRKNVTKSQRDSIIPNGPCDVLDHATRGIASGSKLGLDATKKFRAKDSDASVCRVS